MLVSREQFPFFNALASTTRLHIIELLMQRRLNITEIASELELSATVIAKHISIMEKAGVVRCESIAGKHGIQKVCSLIHSGMALNFRKQRKLDNVSVFAIPIGHYVDWKVAPTCGLSTLDSIIGYTDDPRYFADPRRVDARLIWVGHGYLEYRIPNYLSDHSAIQDIRIQLEICSEAPGFDPFWPSDIYFAVNNVYLGFWTSPGDFGDKPGLFSPEWYSDGNSSEYGQLKTIKITRNGSFIDGEKISDITLDDLCIAPGEPIRFRIESPQECKNPRGFNLFGKGFGNYDQDINVTITTYENI